MPSQSVIPNSEYKLLTEHLHSYTIAHMNPLSCTLNRFGEQAEAKIIFLISRNQ